MANLRQQSRKNSPTMGMAKVLRHASIQLLQKDVGIKTREPAAKKPPFLFRFLLACRLCR
jgi:hypothetical protein